MKYIVKHVKKLALLASISLLTACASNIGLQNKEAVGVNLYDASLAFPEVSRAWMSEGDFVNTENLRKVAPGLTKNELYYLLKHPHFSEGLFGVKVWNYIFNFKTGNGFDYVTCQYQIHFDSNNRVKSTYWKDQQCNQFLAPTEKVIERIIVEKPAPQTIVQQVAASNEPTQRFNVAGDVLFAFNRSNLTDLLPGGRTELDQIIAQIKMYKTIDLVRVIGHTDPLATFDYNFELGQKRARTVANYFASQGIDTKVLQARSAGETELVKDISQCGNTKAVKGSAKQALEACLAPNRRVVVEVIGIKN